jgi:hypothetical protein
MKTIRIAFMICVLLSLTGTARGQGAPSPGALKSQLAYGDGYGARVIVDESPELTALLDRFTETGGQQVRVYRITIFSNNAQTGREQAAAAMSRFQSAFPGIPVERSYDNPNWKVFAGYCLTQDEAVALYGQVVALFGSATLSETTIPVSQLRLSRAQAQIEAGEPEDGTTPQEDETPAPAL